MKICALSFRVHPHPLKYSYVYCLNLLKYELPGIYPKQNIQSTGEHSCLHSCLSFLKNISCLHVLLFDLIIALLNIIGGKGAI